MLSPIAAQPLPSTFGHPKTGTPSIQSSVVQVSVVETYSRTDQVETRGRAIGSMSTGPMLGGTDGVQAYKAVEAADTAVNPFAKTILSFIDAQIRRDLADGASADQLKSRLEAGLKGFEEGYGDAFKQLSDMGLLNDELRTEIEGTRSQVLVGIQRLADELGIDVGIPQPEQLKQAPSVPSTAPHTTITPAPLLEPGKALLSAVLRDVQIIEQYQKATKTEATYEHLGRPRVATQSQSYGVQESRDFSLRLRTAEGDAVTIKMSADRSGSAQLSYGAGREGMSAALSRQGSQSSSVYFSVEGELDEDELSALNDLLGQVGDISEQFFQGDLGRAFQLAMDLSFDQTEIASFDLALNMSRSEASQTVVADKQPTPARAQVGHTGFKGFMEGVMRAGDLAERLGQPRTLVADLLDWVANNQSHKPHGALLAPAARALL